jgi:hypothetical protein
MEGLFYHSGGVDSSKVSAEVHITIRGLR